MKIGCDDCGKVYPTKASVPAQCRPYTAYVVKDASTPTGYTWANAEDPDYR